MISDILPVIEHFLIGFQRNPEGSGDDTTLRRDLYSALYRHFQEQNASLAVPKSSLDVAYYPEISSFKLTPVKTAYPAAEKFDIAVLAARSEEKAPEKRFDAYWEQPVAFALNLHLCTDEEIAERYVRKLDKDLKQMERYRTAKADPENFVGISLLLVVGDAPEAIAEPLEASLAAGLHRWMVGSNGLFALKSAE